jgi:hypothetical protein
VFFKTLAFAAIERTEAHEQVVRKRVAVGLELQLLAGPAFTLHIASVKFLETVD